MREVESWTTADLARLCSAGMPVTHGPLNDTYRVEAGPSAVFVRHRVVESEDYGQTFAAEEYLPHQLMRQLHIPRLYRVLQDRAGRRAYALFEFIDGTEPDWNLSGVLDTLVENLARIHVIAGNAFGNIRGPFQSAPPSAYLSMLLAAELGRLRSACAPAGELRATTRHLTRIFSVFDSERPCLCHGDVHPGNFLMDDAGRMWLVDWEAARFRVAAADFNQMHMNWLDDEQQRTALTRYCDLTGRRIDLFAAQVGLLRLLWHVRTYNFHVSVLAEPPQAHAHHLRRALDLSVAALDREP